MICLEDVQAARRALLTTRDDRRVEAESRGFGQPPLRTGNATNLTSETDLAEYDDVAGDRTIGASRCERECESEISGRLSDGKPAGSSYEHILFGEPYPRALLQHAEQ